MSNWVLTVGSRGYKYLKLLRQEAPMTKVAVSLNMKLLKEAS